MSACIVIPCYNESKRIDTPEFIRFIEKNDYFFLFVNDGSTDNTLEVLEKIRKSCPEQSEVISVPKNGGKAEAVRFGMNHALESNAYPLLGFLDSDLATPLDEMKNLIECIEANPAYHMVMAIRLKRLGSKVNRGLRRHYLGRVFATLVSIFLGLPTYDTQCGAKIIRKDLARPIFQDPFLSPWFFDVELLFRIKKERGTEFANHNIYEYPIMTWNEMWGSKIGLSTYLKAPLELFRIWLKYRR